MYKLSILIPTLHRRKTTYDILVSELQKQKEKYPAGTIEIRSTVDDGELTIGEKRNILLSQAKGKYFAFIDDDDMVSENYIDLLMAGISTDADCLSLIGEYWVFDGNKFNYDRNFFHSLKYHTWYDDALGYYRNPNHLNCIKTDLVRDIPFPSKSHGEDSDWSKMVLSLGRLKTEAEIPFVLYKYYSTPQHLKKV